MTRESLTPTEEADIREAWLTEPYHYDEPPAWWSEQLWAYRPPAFIEVPAPKPPVTPVDPLTGFHIGRALTDAERRRLYEHERRQRNLGRLSCSS